jgi:hypothetical protein
MASETNTRITRRSTGTARCGAHALRRWLLLALAAGWVGESPRAALGLETLVVSVVKLRYDNSTTRDTGSLKMRALVDDNSTVGQLPLGLLAGTVAVEISDGAQFNVVVTLTGCDLTPSEGVRCRSSDGTVKLNLIPTAQGPYIYNMRLLARRLPDTAAGTAIPVGPVSVVLHQPGADRADVIGTCAPRGEFSLLCREL